MKALLLLAQNSLKANIISTSEGPMLAAGHSHFRTLWTRDFCFSVPGLLLIGERDLARRQLELIWKHQRKDGLLPRGIDVMAPQLRVIMSLLKRGPIDNYEG